MDDNVNLDTNLEVSPKIDYKCKYLEMNIYEYVSNRKYNE